jgi:hypothetical protein
LSFWHMHNWVIYYLVQWLMIIKHFQFRCKSRLETIFCRQLYVFSFTLFRIILGDFNFNGKISKKHSSLN